jgi:N-acetylmuramoyl-L-alanine amidase
MDGMTRLTLELLPAPGDAPPAADPGVAPPVSTTAAPPIDLSTFGQPATPIRTVTLDPGHGGADEGVKGAGGLTEKAVTLSVARRIKTALEARLGLRVLLTREDDRELPFDGRTSVANNNKADLFISLHVNASFRPTASGAAIYVAEFADDGSTRQSLEPHRVPVFGGGLRDIELVRWNEAQIRYVHQSTAFAEILRQQLDGRIPLDTRATDRAPLRVLASANMPAVLVELGYLTNAEQEARLGSSEFQGTVAGAIVESVGAFRDYLGRTPEAAR